MIFSGLRFCSLVNCLSLHTMLLSLSLMDFLTPSRCLCRVLNSSRGLTLTPASSSLSTLTPCK